MYEKLTNARILRDICPKNAQMLHDNCPKNIFSYAYARQPEISKYYSLQQQVRRA